MVLVCLSHIKHHFLTSAPELHWFLVSTTRIATPTFLLLSGFVISHLLRSDKRRGVPIMLIDRGLFLILVAHAALSLDNYSGLFSRVEITDVVGFALFVAIMMRGASLAVLATTGAAICLASWVIAIAVPPAQSDTGRLLFAALFNLFDPHAPMENVPIMPYLGAFLLGMALNVHLMPKGRSIAERDIARRLTVIAVAAFLTVLAGIVAWHFGKGFIAAAVSDAATVDDWRSTFSPTSKDPPSPAYFLFYGGVGLLLLAFFFNGRPKWFVEQLKEPAGTIGRASLMCFVAQDWLLSLIPEQLGFDAWTSPEFWFGYWVAVVLVLYGLARLWGSYRGNRFLTVGLKALAKRWDRSHPPACLPSTPRSVR
jgi:hypothetical protein